VVRLDGVEATTRSIVYKGVSAYNVDYSNLDRSDINNTTILFTFGECDIRRHLPKYKNPEEVVEKYVNTSLKFFKGLDVVFMQPVPQAIDELTYEFNSNKEAWHPFEERMAQQKIFYESLKNYNQKVIDISEAIGIDHLTSEYTDDGCHLTRKTAIDLVRYINIAVN
jgi:hypothetical protein